MEETKRDTAKADPREQLRQELLRLIVKSEAERRRPDKAAS